MRPRDNEIAQKIAYKLQELQLPGIESPLRFSAFVEQILESIHRVKYVSTISKRQVSELRADPQSDFFDPLKASILWKERGNIDEAFWMVFIFVHFGKNKTAGWNTARNIYGRLGSSLHWNWRRTSSNPYKFREWLATYADQIPCRFGNHRKYESLNAWSARGTGAAFESYVSWVSKYGNHQGLINLALQESANDARVGFDYLYRSMSKVVSFGRTAKFDYLTMIAKLGLAPIEACSAYLSEATGPYKGALLLFSGKRVQFSRKELDDLLIELESLLGVGMQVLEDSLCNWQKSPDRFTPFRG